MSRLVALVLLGSLATAAARADIAPPGTRNIPVEHKFVTNKEHPGWKFFVVRGSGGVNPVKFDPKNPVVIPGNGASASSPAPKPGDKKPLIPYRSNLLVAVPHDVATKYPAEKDLHAAVEAGKAEGLVRAKDHFPDFENAKATDTRKGVVRRFLVGKLDPKEGIIIEPIKDGEKKDGKEEEEGGVSARPGSWWVAGLAASLGLALGGVWLTGRFRRGRQPGA